MASEKRVFATCPRDCYDTCAMYAFVNDGRIAKVVGRRDHGLTKGFLCRKGQNILDYVYSPDRLQHQMERVGAKSTFKMWKEILLSRFLYKN